jgi:uncharacterized membrane protein
MDAARTVPDLGLRSFRSDRVHAVIPDDLPKRWTGADFVAVILALGVCMVVVLFVLAAVIDSFNKNTALSDNATQILTGAIGGMVGVLGGYVGRYAQERSYRKQEETNDDAG